MRIGGFITKVTLSLWCLRGLTLYTYTNGNHVIYVAPLGLFSLDKNGFENTHANLEEPEFVSLYRAVGPSELSDIQSTGAFNNVLGIETKYFTTSGEKASEYAKKAVLGFGDDPYTIVKTDVHKNILNKPMFFAEVDGGIPAYVLPSNILLGLKPIALPYSPIPKVKK